MIRAVVTAIDARGVYVRTSEFGDVGPIQWIGDAPAPDDRVIVGNAGDDVTPDLVVLGVVS